MAPTPSGKRERARNVDADAETARYLAFADAVIRALLDGAAAGADHVPEAHILRELGRLPGDRDAHALLERMGRHELIARASLGPLAEPAWRLQARGRRLAGVLSAALDEQLHTVG